MCCIIFEIVNHICICRVHMELKETETRDKELRERSMQFIFRTGVYVGRYVFAAQQVATGLLPACSVCDV